MYKKNRNLAHGVAGRTVYLKTIPDFHCILSSYLSFNTCTSFIKSNSLYLALLIDNMCLCGKTKEHCNHCLLPIPFHFTKNDSTTQPPTKSITTDDFSLSGASSAPSIPVYLNLGLHRFFGGGTDQIGKGREEEEKDAASWFLLGHLLLRS